MENTDTMKKAKTVLVVDDEEEIVKLLRFNLEKEGYSVQAAYSGVEAIESAVQLSPDMIILDVMLPEADGLEVCRRLRSHEGTAHIPILMLSARKEELDKVLGLEMGADDYMIKPFSVREIIARVRAILRREERYPPGQKQEDNGKEKVLRIGRVSLYPERYQVLIAGEECALTHKEFALLHLLMLHAGKVLTRDQLLERVWGFAVEVDTRTVDVHIRYLRQKIEEDPAKPGYILTVRGVGYRFADVCP